MASSSLLAKSEGCWKHKQCDVNLLTLRTYPGRDRPPLFGSTVRRGELDGGDAEGERVWLAGSCGDNHNHHDPKVHNIQVAQIPRFPDVTGQNGHSRRRSVQRRSGITFTPYTPARTRRRYS